MAKYNPNIPIDSTTGSTLIAQFLNNDATALNLDPDAIISGSPAIGTIVMYDRTNQVWVKYNPETIGDNTLLGIVENIENNNGQIRLSGVYQNPSILPGELYYVQANATLAASETDLLAGHSMSVGNLTLLLNGASSSFGGGSKGINEQIFSTAGTHFFTVPKKVTTLKVTCVGGAGGGGGGGGKDSVYGGNGATGYYNQKVLSVTPESIHTVTVGASGGGGGRGGMFQNPTGGGSGGTTSFGNLLSTSGGGGGGAGNGASAQATFAGRYGLFQEYSIGGAGGVNSAGGAGTAGAVIIEW